MTLSCKCYTVGNQRMPGVYPRSNKSPNTSSILEFECSTQSGPNHAHTPLHPPKTKGPKTTSAKKEGADKATSDKMLKNKSKCVFVTPGASENSYRKTIGNKILAVLVHTIVANLHLVNVVHAGWGLGS